MTRAAAEAAPGRKSPAAPAAPGGVPWKPPQITAGARRRNFP